VETAAEGDDETEGKDLPVQNLLGTVGQGLPVDETAECSACHDVVLRCSSVLDVGPMAMAGYPIYGRGKDEQLKKVVR
jgi:hypothetical protein